MSTLSRYKKYSLIFLLVGSIVYFPIFFNGFVWDDFNQAPHQWDFMSFFGPNTFNTGSFYRPVSALYFAFLQALFSQHAFPFHLIQLSLHILNTSLLFSFMLLFFSETVAFFLALLFLVHPINVESVAYISSTNSELFFLFGMCALLLGITRKLSGKKAIGISLLLLLAALTKEAGFLFIIPLLLYRYIYKLDRLRLMTLAGACAGIVYLLLRIFVGEVKFASDSLSVSIPIQGLSIWQRLMTIPAVLLYYLKTFIFPVDLSIWQLWVVKTPDTQAFIFPLLICITLALSLFYGIFLLYRSSNSRPHDKVKHFTTLGFFFVWYLVGMVPVSQLIPLEMTVADRWSYFLIVGILGIIGVELYVTRNFLRQHKRVAIIIAAIIIVCLSTRSFIRTLDWNSDSTLYEHDVKLDPKNSVLTSNYAASLYSSGNTEEALEYAKRSVDLSPDLGNQYTLGVIYQEREQYAAAVAAYQKAIQAYKTQSVHTIDTDSKLRSVDDVRLEDIYDSLALIYHLQGRPFDAIHSLEEGLIKFPLSSRLYFTMALAQYEVGNREGALAAITKSYQISPKEASKTILFRLKNNLPLH